MKTNTRHWAGIAAGILSLTGYASAAVLGSEKYTYDASGNLVEKSIDGKQTRMAFDNDNRLLSKEHASESMDHYSYDGVGRPVLIKDTDGREVRRMDYGYSDKVVSAISGDQKVELYYNAEGLLVGKAMDGNVSSYAWDGTALASRDGEAYTNEAHVTGGVPVIQDGEAVISDYLGTTLMTGSRQFNGTAFGEGQEAARFTGKVYVEELEGFLFPCRLYCADSATWTVADPSGYPNGKNNVSYVNGDPVSRLDPTGLDFLMFDGETVSFWENSEGVPNGYQTNGSLVWGDFVQSWPAISNSDSQDMYGGKTPQGWYAVGQEYATGGSKESDWYANGVWNQGRMCLWGQNGSDFGTDVFDTAGKRSGRTTTASLSSFDKRHWKFAMGVNWIDNRKKDENTTDIWIYPDTREPGATSAIRIAASQSTIKIHPEGSNYGTHGCMGIVGYANVVEIEGFLSTHQGTEIFVEY